MGPPPTEELCIRSLIVFFTTDRRDSESLKIFNGDKFAVWKNHMEICLEDMDIMPIVNGTIPKPPETATEADEIAWQKANTQARRMISSSASLPVLENLVNCSTAGCMWTTLLCAFYQQKSRKNIYMVQNNFFEYKMSAGDSINAHVNKVMSMGNLLKDLGQLVPEDMLITKIVCSLPPSYNSVLATWTNVLAREQIFANLKIRLL